MVRVYICIYLYLYLYLYARTSKLACWAALSWVDGGAESSTRCAVKALWKLDVSSSEAVLD